jgi:hypothetical protein
MARRSSSRRTRDWTNIPEQTRKRINAAARRTIANVMNELAELGPRYTGEFIDQWRAMPIDKKNRIASGGGYPYKTRDIPQLATTVKEMRRVMLFEVYNESPYAPQALDLQPGKFRKPKGKEPLGGIRFGLVKGKRPSGGLRGQVTQGEGNASSTAELDWYSLYASKGLPATLKKSFRLSIAPKKIS